MRAPIRWSFICFLIAFSLPSRAQIGVCPKGYFPLSHYAQDFFDSEMGYANIFWSNQNISGTQLDTIITKKPHPNDSGFDCVRDTSSFRYWVDRSNGRQKYTLWQPYGKSEPFGVTFGYYYRQGGTDSSRNTIDLTGGRVFVAFEMENTGLEDITVNVAVLDSTGNRVNSTQGNEVWCTVLSGETIDTVLSFNTYACLMQHVLDSCGIESSPPFQLCHSFDPSIVFGVEFRVVNAKRVSSDGDKHPALVAQTFSLTKFFVGDVSIWCVPYGITDNYMSAQKLKVMPNPISSGVLKFEESKNIKVIDVLGNVVHSTAEGSQISVDGLPKGVYLLQTSSGSSRFIVE